MDRTIKKEANKFRKHKLTCSDACVMLLWVYIHTGQAWKICLATVGFDGTRAGLKNMRATVGSGVDIYTQSNITQASYSPEYIAPTQQIS
jgi:hypothetical protein